MMVAAVMIASTNVLTPAPIAMAASSDYDYLVDTSDIDAQIALLEQKKKEQQEAARSKLDELEQKIADLQEDARNSSQYDASGAIDSLAAQINELHRQLEEQIQAQQDLLNELQEIKGDQAINVPVMDDGYHTAGAPSSSRYLVNPGPSAEVSYTQDALNAQGDSTMIFTYAPNQLYKIYCRLGFLTDLEFKKGEEITFVGGGDTSAWMVEAATIDGTPHIYVKPVVETSATNLIVNTNKRSYQILLNTSDWYNPMVRWNYGNEERIQALYQKQKDRETYTDTLSTAHPDTLNFDYSIKGDAGWKPIMVFDDGKKTYIKFKNMSGIMPVLFVREPGKREVSIVNYKVKDNFYIIDKIVSEAQLKGNDGEIIRIVNKKHDD